MQLFLFKLESQQCLKKKVMRKISTLESDIVVVDHPSSPVCTHQGQDIKKNGQRASGVDVVAVWQAI